MANRLFLSLVFCAFSPLSDASSSCFCIGYAAVFAKGDHYIDIESTGEVECKQANSCALDNGTIHRVYFSENHVLDQPFKSYMNESAIYLINKDKGFTFQYVLSMQETGGKGAALWHIQPEDEAIMLEENL